MLWIVPLCVMIEESDTRELMRLAPDNTKVETKKKLKKKRSRLQRRNGSPGKN
jgi:hypothetical protein